MRKSNTRQCQALCVRLPEASGPSFVSSHYIQESPGGERDWPGGTGLEAEAGPAGFWRTASLPISQASRWRDLSSSSRTSSSSSAPTATPGEPALRCPCLRDTLSFHPYSPKDPSLICPLSGPRDILLLQLQLPRAIRQAATHKELEAISHLGVGKGSSAAHCIGGQTEAKGEREGPWAHSLGPCRALLWAHSLPLPEAPVGFFSLEFWSSSLNTKAQPGPSEGPLLPRLKPRPPQELDQGTGAALCFFNPLFPGDLGPTKREKFKRSFKVRVSTETSSPLSPPAVPPPPVPVPLGADPSQTERMPPRQLLRRESSVGYRVPGGASPSLPPLPSLQEVDCGSPSSSEEEEGMQGCQGSPATSPRLSLRNRRRPLLRSMSSAFCSLLAPERQVGRTASALMQDRHTAVGQLVQDLLTQVRAGPEPQELQGIREALSRAQAMLSAELGPEKLLPPNRLGETPVPAFAGSAPSLRNLNSYPCHSPPPQCRLAPHFKCSSFPILSSPHCPVSQDPSSSSSLPRWTLPPPCPGSLTPRLPLLHRTRPGEVPASLGAQASPAHPGGPTAAQAFRRWLPGPPG